MVWKVDLVKRIDERKPQCPGIDVVRSGGVCVTLTGNAECPSMFRVRDNVLGDGTADLP